MGWFSSGKKYKRRAENALRTAEDIQDYQSEQEFRRGLLSNIRQERIARAQLEVGNYSTVARSSSAEGAIANIDSSLAGETYFSYASSDRAQQIQDYQEYAQKQYKKYAKQQQKRSTAFSIAGIAAGALTGGALGAAGLLGTATAAGGAIAGAQIGQGLGQIAANTGQQATQIGIQNMLSGTGQGLQLSGALRKDKTMYETTSINPVTNQPIAGSQQYYMPNSSYGLTPINFLRS